EILYRVKTSSYISSSFDFSSDDLIFLKDCVLNRKTKNILPHGPFWFNTYSLPIRYDQKAKADISQKFIDSLTDNEDEREFLYEIFALPLLRRNDKAIMLVGSGSNGKSTYLILLRTFLGKDNVSAISLQELTTHRFKCAELFGKIANIYADIPKQPLQYTGIFKILTGGDTLYAEKKFKDPFPFANKAVLIFSANELPEVNDQTLAFWRRWIVLEFRKRFPENEEIKKMIENLPEEEMSGLLNIVLEKMEKIEEKGLTIVKSSEEIKEYWKRKSNTVYAFIQDCIEVSPDFWSSKDVIYSAYVTYCSESDLVPLDKAKFALEFLRFVNVREVRKTIAGKRVYGWQGVKVKEEREE
ncbi:MAG: phage/plasmid primase, P4 family, partial [Leptospiraceae bacterium]|nr:phage/plasmid primase, P4 family [Leptospiraceae bacterium]